MTMVELLIGLALISLLLPVLIASSLRAAAFVNKFAGIYLRAESTAIAIERIGRDIREADEVLAASGPDEIFLRSGTDTVSYRLWDGMVRRRSGSSSAYLTEKGDVDSLAFSYASPEGVTVFFGHERMYVEKRGS